MNSKKSKITFWISGMVLLSLFVGAFALAFPSGSVMAASTAPTPQPTTTVDKTARLENAYQKAQKALATQSTRLEKINARVQKISDRIDALKNKGKDVTALENALQNFKNSLANAVKDHQSAADVLATHNGFDAQGKVTDAARAKDTLQLAAQDMRSARQEMTPALRDLVQAVRDYVRDNRGKK